MTSPTTTTMIKMMETLPEKLQERVLEHIRDYIEDLRDEANWNESFSKSQEKLAAAAQRARKEIAEGKATPLNPNGL